MKSSVSILSQKVIKHRRYLNYVDCRTSLLLTVSSLKP